MLKRWGLIITAALLLTLGAIQVNAQEQQGEFTGYMGDDVSDNFYAVELVAGDMITVEAFGVSGNLDTHIGLQSPAGDLVIDNDDRETGVFDSAFTYTAPEDGTYQVIMSNYPETSGDYRLTIQIKGAGTIVGASDGGSSTGSAPDAEAGLPFTANAVQYTGYMGDDVSDDLYPVELQPGQTVRVVAAAAPGSSLDTFLFLKDSNDKVVIENDDRGVDTFDSEIIYTAAAGGTFTVGVSNYPGSSGDYELTIDVLDEATANELLANIADAQRNVVLSGPALTRETEHFIIQYTLEGGDATTEEYVEVAAQSLEEVWQIQIAQGGWPAPPPDNGQGGDDRIDIYILDLLKADGEGALGEASPGFELMDNPNTPEVEEFASYSYFTLDNRLDEENTNEEIPYSLLRATIAHEFHHGIQHGYDINDAHIWYYEATSTWIETYTYPKEQDAVGYVDENYAYPEICFGANNESDPTGGLLRYGDWMFIQSLVDAYGLQVVPELWQNIALEEGFAPLQTTLVAHGEDIPTALARYRLQNLVRDYELTPLFDATVWLENTISEAGAWQPEGQGIQELAANYFRVTLPAGTYAVALGNTADTSLQLWAVGIRGEEADALSLGNGGVIDTTGYDDYYLMVFNTAYDDDVDQCVYQQYSIDVKMGAGEVAPTVYTLNASQFEPLN